MGIVEKFCKLSGLEYPVKGIEDSDIEAKVRNSVCASLIDSFINRDTDSMITNNDIYNTLNKPMPFGVFKIVDCVDTYLAVETVLVNSVVDDFKSVNKIETGYSILGYMNLFNDVLGDKYNTDLLLYTRRFLVFNLILSVLLDTDDTDFDRETCCDREGRFVLVGRDKDYIMKHLERILTFYFENSTDEVANLDDVVLNICEVLKHVE